MTATANYPSVSSTVAEAAMTWWVDLQCEPVTDELRSACARWRAESQEHEQAWQIIVAAHGRLRESGLPSALAHATLAMPSANKARRRAIKTLAVLVFAGGTAWTARPGGASRQWLADYRSGVGECREVVLADGTQVTLDSDTALDVRFDGNERCLRLISGRIYVESAPDTEPVSRPLVVDTAQGRARAIGTRFTVEQDAAFSRVAVFEGAVALTPRDGESQARVLSAGQQARFNFQAVTEVSPAAESEVAWRQGMLIVTAVRLDDFIAELQRYRQGWLICDPQVAALKVSGSFPLADTELVLDALANTLPVDIVRRTRYWAAVRLRPVHG